MSYGIILLKSLIDKDTKIKAIAKSLNLNRVNSYAKLNIDKFSTEMKYRLSKYVIWGSIDDKYSTIIKAGLHPIKGGHNKIKNTGYIDNFEKIFENMYSQKIKI